MRIEYEAVVSGYVQSLQTQLRNFRPAHEFLETWVHDEDPAKSLLNMAEAASLGGESSLDIAVGPETLRTVDPLRLERVLAQAGKVQLVPEGKGLLLRISFQS